jgi:type VI protein secretion system component Hcp
MAEYARFDGFPGDCIRNGQQWITLDTWMHAPTTVVSTSRASGGVGRARPSDLILFIHGLTAASSFALAVVTGRPIKSAEIVTTAQEAKEVCCLLIRMQDIIITSVARTPPPNQQISTLGQRVEIAYGKITWTYTSVPSQPHPPMSYSDFAGLDYFWSSRATGKARSRSRPSRHPPTAPTHQRASLVAT